MPKKSRSYAVRIPWIVAVEIVGDEEELRRRAKTGQSDYKANGVPVHIVAHELLRAWEAQQRGASVPPAAPTPWSVAAARILTSGHLEAVVGLKTNINAFLTTLGEPPISPIEELEPTARTTLPRESKRVRA